MHVILYITIYLANKLLKLVSTNYELIFKSTRFKVDFVLNYNFQMDPMPSNISKML